MSVTAYIAASILFNEYHDKQVLTGFAVALTTVAGAQTQKGNGIISGGLSVGYSTIDFQSPKSGSRTWTPALDVTAGRFVADNWLVGASVAGAFSMTDVDFPNILGSAMLTGTTGVRSMNVSVTPFVRRYWQFAPVQVFAGVGLSVNSANVRQTSREFINGSGQVVPVETKTNSFQIAPELQAGVNYLITNRLAVQLMATANSLPFNVGGFQTGLVYWTGPNLKEGTQNERTNEQTNKGNWFIEGSFSTERAANRIKTGLVETRNTDNQYVISPSVGYFINKNNLLGLSVPLQFYNSENGQQTPASSNTNRGNA